MWRRWVFTVCGDMSNVSAISRLGFAFRGELGDGRLGAGESFPAGGRTLRSDDPPPDTKLSQPARRRGSSGSAAGMSDDRVGGGDQRAAALPTVVAPVDQTRQPGQLGMPADEMVIRLPSWPSSGPARSPSSGSLVRRTFKIAVIALGAGWNTQSIWPVSLRATDRVGVAGQQQIPVTITPWPSSTTHARRRDQPPDLFRSHAHERDGRSRD
jgi:hypothetical protein